MCGLTPHSSFHSGVDICIRDFNGGIIRIREMRRVKVGHIATGISDQVRGSRIIHSWQNLFQCLERWRNLTLVLFYRSLRGFSLWKPSRANWLLMMRRWRSLGWISAVFLLQTSALPGSGGLEMDCWRQDRVTAVRHLNCCTCKLLLNCLNVGSPCCREGWKISPSQLYSKQDSCF